MSKKSEHGADIRLFELGLLAVVGSIPLERIDIVGLLVEVDLGDHLGVERDGALGDAGREDDDDGEDGELDRRTSASQTTCCEGVGQLERELNREVEGRT